VKERKREKKEYSQTESERGQKVIELWRTKKVESRDE